MQRQFSNVTWGNKSKWRLLIAYRCTWQQMDGARGHRYSKWIQKLDSQQYVTPPQALWCHGRGVGGRDDNIDSCRVKGKRKKQVQGPMCVWRRGGHLTCCWLLLWQYICLHAWKNTCSRCNKEVKHCLISGRPLRVRSALPNGPYIYIRIKEDLPLLQRV